MLFYALPMLALAASAQGMSIVSLRHCTLPHEPSFALHGAAVSDEILWTCTSYSWQAVVSPGEKLPRRLNLCSFHPKDPADSPLAAISVLYPRTDTTWYLNNTVALNWTQSNPAEDTFFFRTILSNEDTSFYGANQSIADQSKSFPRVVLVGE